MRDSAEVQIAVSREAAWGPSEGWAIGDATLVIGGGAGGDLFDVAGAVRLSDGRIVVADGGSGQVRIHAADGALERVLGTRGEGPEEFQLLQSIGLGSADTVWAYDFASQRMSFIHATDGFARSVSLRPRLPAAVPVGQRSDGSFVVAQMWGTGDPRAPSTGGLSRELAVYARYGSDGLLVDTLGAFPGREVWLRAEGGRVVMGVAPFARTSTHTLVGDDLVVGDQEGYTLEWFGPDGGLIRRVSWNGPLLDLSGDAVDGWRESQIASAPPDERTSVRAYLADVPLPDRRPAYGRIVPDVGGGFWVAAYSHPAQAATRWDVFDGTGRWLGTVSVDPRFRPWQLGTDWVLGLGRDDLDVERVELRTLRR